MAATQFMAENPGGRNNKGLKTCGAMNLLINLIYLILILVQLFFKSEAKACPGLSLAGGE